MAEAARRAERIRPGENALQSLEAVERQGHLHPHDGRSGHTSSSQSQDDHDRRDLSQSAPPGVEPAGKNRRSGRLIGRRKAGMNTKLNAAKNANGRPTSFFITAGQVSDYTGAAALLDSLPKAQWVLADRSSPTGSATPCRKRASCPAFRAGKYLGSSNTTSAATNAATATRSCSAVSRIGDGSQRATTGARRPSSPP